VTRFPGCGHRPGVMALGATSASARYAGKPKILVTNLPETVTARERVSIYLRRWWIELLMKEPKGVVGLGQH
jgi:hypothetical protein